MERPGHAVAAVAAGNKKNKTIATAIVIGIHVFIIIALIIGLRQAALRKEAAALNASVEQAKAIPKAPPPPPPDLIRPPPPASIVPDFAIVAPPKAPPAPPPAPPAPPAQHVAPTQLSPIMRTHTQPQYPTISQRLGEQGTVTLNITIGVNGTVTACSVAKTSGSARLDQAAVEWVKANWKWNPPTRDGQAVEANTQVNVKFDLKDAQ